MARAAGLQVLAFEEETGRDAETSHGAAHRRAAMSFGRCCANGLAAGSLILRVFEQGGLSGKIVFPAAENHDQICVRHRRCSYLPSGKGIAAASLRAVLESRGLKVTSPRTLHQRHDPGTINPLQHGGGVRDRKTAPRPTSTSATTGASPAP